MGRFVLGTFFHIIAFVCAESNFQVLQELISRDFAPTWNVITCNENESINLIKMLSARFPRFVVPHRADKALMPFLFEPQSFILDLHCQEASTVLQQADDLHLFKRPFRWILLGDGITPDASAYKTENYSESGGSWSWPFLESLNILIDSDVKVVEKSSDEKISVMGAYKLGNTFVQEPLAEWTSNSFRVFNLKPLPARRWNLRNVPISSSTVVRPESLFHLEDLVDKQIDSTSKVTYNTVKIIGELLKANISFTREDEWGRLVNGSWTGMIGGLERNEIEIGGAPLFLQKNRMHIVEYIARATTTRFKFLFLAPPLSYSNNIFAMPFDTIVWGCCFSLVTIACCFLYTALNYEKVQLKDNKISFTEILVINIGAICLQGTVVQSKNPPGRIFTLFLYLSYMFLYISYSACIVAILQSADNSIQTLSDFLKSSLKAGAEDVAYSRNHFANAEGEVQRAIYRTKIAPKNELPHFLPVKEGVNELRKGFYGFHVEVSLGYLEVQKTFTEEEKCGLRELRESFFQFPEPYIVVRKRTPYAEHFAVGTRLVIERGLQKRLISRYYVKKPICTSKAARFVSVGIIDSYYAFMLLSFGVVTSFLVMLSEIAFSRYLKNRERHTHLSNNNLIPGFEFYN